MRDQDDLRWNWMRSLCSHFLVIDGYPELDENGGAKGLADVHCVGSYINHSVKYSNAVYHTIHYKSPNLISCDGLEVPMYSIIVMTKRNISKHEQILVNYQAPHFAEETVEIPFM